MKDFLSIFENQTRFGTKIYAPDYLEHGNYPIVDQSRKLICGYKNEPEGLYKDIPFIIFGDVTRIIKYIDFPCFLGADGSVILKVKDKNYDTKYLYYHLLKQYIPDTGYNRHYKFLKELQFKQPTLEKQKIIVSILDNINSLIQKSEQEISLYDELIRSRFIEMFGDIYNNPKHCKMQKIGDIAFVTKLAGFEYTQFINYKEKGDKIMVRGLNCKKGKLILDDVYYENNDVLTKLKRSSLSKGDIVMTYVGTIAETALIDEDNKYHLAPNVAKISLLDKEKNNPTFFINMLVLFRDYIIHFSTATSQPKISMELIREIPLMVPPTEKQNEFANFVENVEKLKNNTQKRIEQYQELLRKKMDEYFD